MNILAVGDSYMPTRYFSEAFAHLESRHRLDYLQIDPHRPFDPETPSEQRLREYQGSPAELVERMAGMEVLVVQGAPVSDAVLDASRELRLIGCARGGPVNVDVDAASARGLILVNTPGKNAHAVADQTLAFLVMLARGFPRAQGFLQAGGQLRDNWEGARFIGRDLRHHTLGLVGYGRVGRLVAHRALAFGMDVLIYDPMPVGELEGGVRTATTLDELLAGADFVSLHARATSENENLFDAATFAKMRRGSFFVNTAREVLVDERALGEALSSGRLAGAALDVVRPSQRGVHPLLGQDNVIMTPHIGGATHETLAQGAEMLAKEIERFSDGKPLRYVVNGDAVTP